MATRLTLISHAATQAQRRAAFPLDEPLEERETAKIAALGWKAPRAQRVLAAPERRTQETAHALGLPVAIAAELRDCDYGEWQGRELSELQSLDPEGFVAWLTDPLANPHGGESIVSLIDRVARWMNGEMETAHTIAVTHPPVIRSAIVHALQAPPQSFFRIDVAPLSITDLRFNGKAWTLRSTGHRLSPTIDEGD
ncbi:MAG TPA: histidine phosphatase family protein [Terriglobales bacterium]